mmetsp:Transcript_27613/g.78105  ORF Transcript_27613/g.78105 Transcript_27613/m.78105 type:complete len:161 (-) Transcript_27613:1026-1508(-)
MPSGEHQEVPIEGGAPATFSAVFSYTVMVVGCAFGVLCCTAAAVMYFVCRGRREPSKSVAEEFKEDNQGRQVLVSLRERFASGLRKTLSGGSIPSPPASADVPTARPTMGEPVKAPPAEDDAAKRSEAHGTDTPSCIPAAAACEDVTLFYDLMSESDSDQ